MAFGGDKAAADASWPGMCQAFLVSPLLLLCLPTAPGTWLLLHRALYPLLSAFVKTQLVFLWNSDGYFVGILMFLCKCNM